MMTDPNPEPVGFDLDGNDAREQAYADMIADGLLDAGAYDIKYGGMYDEDDLDRQLTIYDEPAFWPGLPLSGEEIDF